ncbi:MAG: hypothetical protein ABIQ01_04300 [Pseudolysinimonas sp.]
MARSPLPPPELSAAGPSDRALQVQILATEHWSLLASRSTTQSEVLTRIAMFLTFVSASLLSLALVGNATGFGEAFPMFAIAVLAVALLVGFLTQIRVYNVAVEDLMYVVAMNRLRGAYASLVPGVEKWFMSSPHDDRAGGERTYFFFRPERGASVVLGSSMVFIVVVNATLGGLLAATIVAFTTGSFVWAAIVGLVVAVAYFVVSNMNGYALYRRVWRHHEPLSPTPAEPGSAG